MSKTKMSKRILIVIIMVMVLSMVACGEKTASKESSTGSVEVEPITIAYIGPITGEASAWGLPELNTLKMLVDEINETGGVLGRTVILKSYDNRSDNVETSNAAKKAILYDGACAIIGCNASGATLALASVCDEYGVPNIATTATNSKVTIADDGSVRPWTFRVCLADPQLGDIMGQYAYNELGYRDIAVLYEVSSDYSVGINKNFSDTFTSLGGVISKSEAYKLGDVDFRAQLANIKKTNPEALFLPMTYKELGLAVNQARDLGMEQQFLGPDCWMANDLFSVAGKAILGSIFVATIDGDDSSLDDFKEWYRNSNDNEEPDAAGQNAYFAYDAFKYLVSAIEKAGSDDSAAIRDALEQLEDVEGLTGTISMIPETHNPIRSAYMFVVEEDRFKALEKFTAVY